MTDEPQTSTPTATASATATADLPPAEDDQLIEEELLVEDVSIDGMCGVY